MFWKFIIEHFYLLFLIEKIISLYYHFKKQNIWFSLIAAKKIFFSKIKVAIKF